MQSQSFFSLDITTTSDNLGEWVVNTDGGCRDNPGPGAWAFVVLDGRGSVLHTAKGFLPHTTNNFAEYKALMEACRYLATVDVPARIRFLSDSKLVVEQINGGWRVNDVLAGVFGETAAAYEDVAGRADVTLTHIKRNLNGMADALCNEVQDEMGIVCTKKGAKKERERA